MISRSCFVAKEEFTNEECVQEGMKWIEHGHHAAGLQTNRRITFKKGSIVFDASYKK